jgi:hypothetical protein
VVLYPYNKIRKKKLLKMVFRIKIITNLRCIKLTFGTPWVFDMGKVKFYFEFFFLLK